MDCNGCLGISIDVTLAAERLKRILGGNFHSYANQHAPTINQTPGMSSRNCAAGGKQQNGRLDQGCDNGNIEDDTVN